MRQLGIGFLLFGLVGCGGGSVAKEEPTLYRGDQTGDLTIEHNGVTQNLQTGRTGFKRGAWIIDSQTGKQTFT